jgi:exodeoxyribonuclease VII small subunit
MDKSPIPAEELTYEQAFQELEEVVSTLETDQQTLEQSLTLFERGQALARRCADLLDRAELRVRKLSEEEPDLPLPTDEEEAE